MKILIALIICLIPLLRVNDIMDYMVKEQRPIKVERLHTRLPAVAEPVTLIGEFPPRRADPLLDALIQVESGGNPEAVSPKGARGLGQAMPKTAKDPGYGVKKMRDQTVKEQLRFAGDYLDAMMQRYGNAKLALAAYNAGPGAVDKVLARMPEETQRYVRKVAREYAANDDQ